MATPEEQKTTLQSSRLHDRKSWNDLNPETKRSRLEQARKKSTGGYKTYGSNWLDQITVQERTRFEMGRKHFGVDDPQRPGELLHTQATRAAGAKDLFDVAELEAKRRAALLANQFRIGPRAPKAEPLEPDLNQQSQTDESTLQAQTEQAQRLAGIQAAISAQTAQQQTQSQQTQQVDEQTRQQREEVKKVAKATMRRGVIYVVNLLAAAFDLGSSGISFIIDIFFYMFTLGWLNLEMFYGRHFAKGKSIFVSPISWDPIPMPVDKEAIILQGFIVAADIALGLAILVLSFGSFCIIHDFVKVTSSITESALIGASLAQGASGGLCMGGIITSTFGL